MKSIFLIPVFLLAFSCGSKLKTKDNNSIISLADFSHWPDSLILETYEGGGMVNESNSVYISKDSCFRVDQREDVTYRYTCKLSEGELDSLFRKIIENNIERLGTKKNDGVVYDKGTTSLTIQLGKKQVNIADGATEEITELRQGDFFTIYRSINDIVKLKAGKTR